MTSFDHLQHEIRNALMVMKHCANRIDKAISQTHYCPAEIVNPTGKGIRSDSMGSGEFGAKRGARSHTGTDYLCDPGQNIVSPINGKFQRIYKVYSGESWEGVEIVGRDRTARLHYVSSRKYTPGDEIQAGDTIGAAVDISQKYGPKMKPHVHCELFLKPREI